ncbi:MAG: phosphoglucomutase/phosphomannomutase family protein [Anaerolineae bacterium]|nr:phosphoglucomutase/phosphomannomutase family protein [Anaerolineae bacterium]
MAIQFGTDGWRAVISDEFTFDNLRKVAQAIADWVLAEAASSPDKPPSMVVGFDTRFLSDRYAAEVACVLAGNSIQVHLAQADAPTPAISYAIVEKQASSGVMITASHNPPRYNGVKLKASHGGSVPSAVGRRVEAYLQANKAQGRTPRRADYAQALAQGCIRRFDPYPAYAQHLRRLVDFDILGRSDLNVLVDPMYGCGRGYLQGLLSEAGVKADEIHGEMNPGFGGLHPEPIGRHLDTLAEAMRSGLWDIGLATDGDADRIGAIAPSGRFVDPHCIFALTLRYLVERRGWRGAVVKTISTTRMINRLADRYGLPLHETPVGFNHISDLMVQEKVLIGGEESGGISVLGHIPEGDGVLMGLLLTEIVAASGRSLDELVDDLMADVGPCAYARRDVKVPADRPYDKREMVTRLMAHLPDRLGDQPVVSVSQLDGVKVLLADESWLLIRPSGTEPVLRIYAEARSREQVEALLRAGASLAGVDEEA